MYELADRVAKALGATPPEGIIVDWQFNAAFGRVGWRRSPILYLGLPLFLILNDRERIALLAHELAHDVNGDPTRDFLTSSAINALLQWHAAIRPTQIIGHTWYHTLANGLMLGLSWPIGLIILLMSHLLWRESQRAEYLADYLSAQVAGTGPVQTALRKLRFGHLLAPTVARCAVSSPKAEKPDLFDEFRRRVPEEPFWAEPETGEAEEDSQNRLDVTHPPLSYRIKFIQSLPEVRPAVAISTSEADQLDRELSLLKPGIQHRLLELHEASLYY